MNGPSSPLHHLRPRSARGVAALVGALLVTAPIASASAAEITDAAARSSSGAPLDLRESLSVQHQRMVEGLGAWIGRALIRSAELRLSLQRSVTFGMSVDDLVAADDFVAADEDDDAPIDDLVADDEDVDDEPAPPRRRQKVDISTDTNDPLEGLF